MAWVKLRFPKLVPIVRFLYETPRRIWVGGGLVPIWRVAQVTMPDSPPDSPDDVITARLRRPGEESPGASWVADVMSSRVGGCQGCGISTAMCCGAHHEMLSGVPGWLAAMG